MAYITGARAASATPFIPLDDANNALSLAVRFHDFFADFTDEEQAKCFVLYLYNAGRIDGIRAERARRRTQAVQVQ